jgi:putative endopeptidase
VTRVVTAAAVLIISGGPALTEPTKPQIAPWGFDLSGMDRSVRPGDDFYRYSNGTWMRKTPIPSDRSSWGPFFILRAKAEADVKAIVQDLAMQPHPDGSIEQKIADSFTSYTNTAAIEKADLAPVRSDLAAIAGARTHEDVAGLMARPDISAGGPLAFNIWPDDRNPDRYTVNISPAGLSLPDRDYYLEPDKKFVEVRGKLRIYIEKMLSLVDYQHPQQSADAILALETGIAKLHWPADKRRNRTLTYNPKSQAELRALAPDYPWGPALAMRGISAQSLFGAKEPDAIKALAKLFRATPVETWRAYMTFHYLNGMADILPVRFDNLAFEFNGRTLLGQAEKRERWRRATSELNTALGEAVGELYVRRLFSPQAKAQITALVENLRTAYHTRIANLTWMSEQTKQAAFRKLTKLRVKVGYPDRWRDYSTLLVHAGDPVGNRERATAWEWHREVARLERRTDRDEWGMTPQTVNAYYNAFFNEIVFPAAILQPPYFDPDADLAVNYGGIGGVIGHEMGHALDDQGSKSDENGVLRTWWKSDDTANFKALVGNLAKQYSQYEPLPGLHLNGVLTLGENIGDNGGLNIALEAYRAAVVGTKPQILDGFSGEQRFFLSWAQTYRENIRDEQLRADIATDPHSPSEFRVNGVVRNMDAWYAAFAVKPGDKLYLAPKDRVHIW